MKTKLARLFTLVVILVAPLIWPNPALPARRARLVVDDDKVECPNAAFTHIQDAVDAASPAAEIHICKGTYAEQVTIRQPLHIDSGTAAVLMRAPTPAIPP